MKSALLNIDESLLHTTMNELGQAIIKTVIYFDVFKYPLTKKELIDYCQYTTVSKQEIDDKINVLLIEGYLKRRDMFYFISDDDSIIERRISGNQLAEKYFRKAEKFSNIISKFPFVECIGISGSLSKNYMEDNSDIDYFIITSPSRLWICRSLLILFKKIFLLNSHKYFCVNYFIDANSLEIYDRNIFTATEMVFLIPTYNLDLYYQLMQKNKWTKEYYPSFARQNLLNPISDKGFVLKGFIERLLNGALGERLDNFFFKITLKHWKKKFKDFNEDEFDLRLRSKKNISKHHPKGFQTKVLKALDEKFAAYEKQFNVTL